ncbi:MAG: hypothetical protein ACOC1K_07085 [Nanoarchaeota archaeon]
MDKNGIISLQMMQWVGKLIFLVIVVFSCIFLIRMYMDTDLEVNETEFNVMIYRLLYSKNGISFYNDVTSEVEALVIDMSKFEELNNSIFYGEENSHIAANIVVKDSDNKVLLDWIYNKDKWKIWEIIANLKWPGPGGMYDSGIRKYPVDIMIDENSIKKGIVEIRLIMPRG